MMTFTDLYNGDKEYMEPKQEVTIPVTVTEALTGCTKIISEGWLEFPIRITIPANVKDGTRYEIQNASYVYEDKHFQQNLYANISIQKSIVETEKKEKAKKGKLTSFLKWLIPVLGLALVGFLIWFFIIK